MDKKPENIFSSVKKASRSLASISDDECRSVLQKLADKVDASHDILLEANARDVSRMSKDNPLYDRLQLTDGRQFLY